MEASLPSSLTEPLRRAIAARVVAIFNDRSRGERPVVRQAGGLFGDQAVAWRVHGDVTSMMVGGMAGLLMQMLLPEVLAGVWDHSSFRADMHGRLRRTARFIALTTYGGAGEAGAAIDRVRGIHDHVHGTLPDGTPYRANDPASLAWVHVTEATSFLGAWLQLVEPDMPEADQDRYFEEMAVVAERLGADPVPRTHRAAWEMIEGMRGRLRADERTRAVAKLVLDDGRATHVTRPAFALVCQAAIDLLPPWARALHGLSSPAATRPVVRAATRGLSRTLRWALHR